jgi:hypothetical protein
MDEIELPLEVQRYLRREGVKLPDDGVTEAGVLAALLVELRAIRTLMEREADVRRIPR